MITITTQVGNAVVTFTITDSIICVGTSRTEAIHKFIPTEDARYYTEQERAEANIHVVDDFNAHGLAMALEYIVDELVWSVDDLFPEPNRHGKRETIVGLLSVNFGDKMRINGFDHRVPSS